MELAPSNWTAIHTHGNCVKITLGEDIDLTKCRLKIISKERQFVEEENLVTREFEVCLPTEEPLFAELSVHGCTPSTKFIEKTGTEFYSKLTDQPKEQKNHHMDFRYRRQVRPEMLNHGGTLFGGELLRWIDEEAAMYAECQLQTKNIVTKLISEVNFMSPGRKGDTIEIGVEAIAFGSTSITLEVLVRNADTEETIVKIDKMVFVAVDEEGKKRVHGVKEKRVK